MIEAIFSAHARYLEQEEKAPAPKLLPGTPLSLPDSSQQLASFALPLKDMQGLGNVSQHNPEQADTPDLPQTGPGKIGEITKAMGIDDLIASPQTRAPLQLRALPDRAGNAGRCRERSRRRSRKKLSLMRNLNSARGISRRLRDKLYVVTNPLDDKEHYNVFLGDPVGCTCGHHHCDHVRAVLNS